MMFGPYGTTVYGAEQTMPATTPFAWGQAIGNKILAPDHQMSGNLGGIILESNKYPFYAVATDLDQGGVNFVRGQVQLPLSLSNVFLNGVSQSNQKRAVLAFRDGYKLIVDDTSTSVRQGNYVVSADDSTKWALAVTSGITQAAGAGRFHFIPIDACVPSFGQQFYTLTFGAGLVSQYGTTNPDQAYNVPSWVNGQNMIWRGDQTLVFVNGYTLFNQINFIWASPNVLKFNSLPGGLTYSDVNTIEVYFIAARSNGRLRHQMTSNVSNQSYVITKDFSDNTRFIGKV